MVSKMDKMVTTEAVELYRTVAKALMDIRKSNTVEVRPNNTFAL